MRKLIKLVLALSVGALVLGFAPTASASHPTNDPTNLCVHSEPDGGGDGEGIVWHLFAGSEAPDDGDSWSCSYTSEGAADSSYTIASLNKVTITVGATTITKEATSAGGPALASGPFSAGANEVVTVTVFEGCAEGSCGGGGDFVVGASG